MLKHGHVLSNPKWTEVSLLRSTKQKTRPYTEPPTTRVLHYRLVAQRTASF